MIVASVGLFESWPLVTDGEWPQRIGTRGEHEYFIKERPDDEG